MPKSTGGKEFSVAVEGLSVLSALPGWLERGQRELLEKALDGLRGEIARKAPGGAHGRAGRDVQATSLTSTKGVIRSKGFVGARALDQGAKISPKKKKALRMHDGRFVRGSVFIKPRQYWKKGLRGRSKIIRAAYHDAFANLEKHQGGGV